MSEYAEDTLEFLKERDDEIESLQRQLAQAKAVIEEQKETIDMCREENTRYYQLGKTEAWDAAYEKYDEQSELIEKLASACKEGENCVRQIEILGVRLGLTVDELRMDKDSIFKTALDSFNNWKENK